jgi:thioredoxin 1
MLAPELQKVASELDGKVKVIKVNVDKNPDAAAKYGVKGIPTLILFNKGQQLWRSSGFQPAAKLTSSLKPYLPK